MDTDNILADARLQVRRLRSMVRYVSAQIELLEAEAEVREFLPDTPGDSESDLEQVEARTSDTY